MSLVYAESYDRLPLGIPVATNYGALGKATEPRCVNVAGAQSRPNLPIVQSKLGRNWIYSSDGNSYWASNGTVCYLHLIPAGAMPPLEGYRPSPVIPPLGSAARVIYQWKVSPGNTAMASGTAYFGYFGEQRELSYSFPTGYVMPAKGYWQLQVVYDIAIKRLRFYIDDVLIGTWTLSGSNAGWLKINLLGITRWTGSTNIGNPVYVTDVMAIYDDGIWPSRPLGDASVRDVLMQAETLHPDAVVVGGQNILTASLKSTTPGLKLVAAGTNVIYKPADTQAALSADPVAAVLVDTARGVGTVAGDLEAKIQTASGSNSIKESPTTFNTNLQSVIRIPTKAMTVQAMKENLRVDLTCRAR